jgi:hypothetical protein
MCSSKKSGGVKKRDFQFRPIVPEDVCTSAVGEMKEI